MSVFWSKEWHLHGLACCHILVQTPLIIWDMICTGSHAMSAVILSHDPHAFHLCTNLATNLSDYRAHPACTGLVL